MTIFKDNIADSPFMSLEKSFLKTMLHCSPSGGLRTLLNRAISVPIEYHASINYLRVRDTEI